MNKELNYRRALGDCLDSVHLHGMLNIISIPKNDNVHLGKYDCRFQKNTLTALIKSK